MTTTHSFHNLLHRATHRIPGVPAHVERPAGHQGTAAHGHQSSLNHSPTRPPRFMPAWQRRIAAFFGQELR